MEKLLIHIIALFLSIPSSILNAVIVSQYWTWFITPTFGVHSPKLVAIIGIAWMISLLTSSYTSTYALEKLDAIHPEESDKLRPLVRIMTSVLVSLFALGIGWVLHLFM